MKSISREDHGYYEAPIDWDEVREDRERKEAHDELESEEQNGGSVCGEDKSRLRGACSKSLRERPAILKRKL